MAEQQSTKCKNMPLRMLGYAARTLEKMVPDTAIYTSAQQRFPIPEFYVLYTGDSPWDDRILRLSDGFLRHRIAEDLPEHSMEVVVTVIDVRYNEDNEIIKRSKTCLLYTSPAPPQSYQSYPSSFSPTFNMPSRAPSRTAAASFPQNAASSMTG